MIDSNDDLEALLQRLERKFERLANDTILVRLGANQPPAALRLSVPVLVIQAEVGEVPSEPALHEPLFRKLLEYNADDLLHAAYALTGNTIVLGAALETANLDPNELEAVFADFDLALSEHTPHLRRLTVAVSSRANQVQ